MSPPTAIMSFGQPDTTASRMGWACWLASLPLDQCAAVAIFEPWKRYRHACTSSEVTGISRVYNDPDRGVVLDVLTRRYENRGVTEVLGALGCVRPSDIEEFANEKREEQAND